MTEPLRVELYDTTLRDGAQGTGFSYSIEDRLRILHKLDQLGVPFVEGGWPGANPRETEFFRLATSETLKHATLTAFGMTRKAGEASDRSAVLRDLLDAGTEVVCLVGKAWDLHVTEALRTDLDEGAAMVGDSIAFLRGQGRRVFFDAEHFFDGYRSDPAFALRVLASAEEAGAERLVLCDTNGGMLPNEVARVVAEVRERVDTPLGIHVHNDAGCAVANSLIAVEHGAFQVQGVVNGYGERTGNADLIPIAANLVLKMGAECLPDGSLERLTEVAHYVAEVANVAPDSRQPYAGRYAFTHKAGLHASGIERVSRAYEHVEPSTVGNRRGDRRERSRGRGDDPDEGRGVRPRAGRRRRRPAAARPQGSRGARVHVRGRRRVARAADAPRGRVAATVLRDRQLPGPRRGARRRRRGAAGRGDRQGRHEGDAAHRERRGPGAGRRARQRAAQGARERLPRARAHLARGLPGARAGRDERARAPSSAS